MTAHIIRRCLHLFYCFFMAFYRQSLTFHLSLWGSDLVALHYPDDAFTVLVEKRCSGES